MKNAMVAAIRRPVLVTALTRYGTAWQELPTMWPGRIRLSSARVHRGRVRRIRRELAEGTYDINGRLNTVIDRLLESLITESVHEAES
jgi:hypothetical protein